MSHIRLVLLATAIFGPTIYAKKYLLKTENIYGGIELGDEEEKVAEKTSLKLEEVANKDFEGFQKKLSGISNYQGKRGKNSQSGIDYMGGPGKKKTKDARCPGMYQRVPRANSTKM